VIFEPEGIYLFLDITSTIIDTLVPLFYQCVETPQSSPAAQSLLSQSRQEDLIWHHLRLRTSLREFFGPVVNRFMPTKTSHSKQETFLYEYPLH
jgi:hypothetical protein